MQIIVAVLGSSVVTSVVNMLINRNRHERNAEKARSLHDEMKLAESVEGEHASEAERMLARFVRADVEERLLATVVPSDRVTSALLLAGGFLSLLLGLVALGATPWWNPLLLLGTSALALVAYVLDARAVQGARAILLSLMRKDSDPPVEGLPKEFKTWRDGNRAEDFKFGRPARLFITPTVRTEVASLIRTSVGVVGGPPPVAGEFAGREHGGVGEPKR